MAPSICRLIGNCSAPLEVGWPTIPTLCRRPCRTCLLFPLTMTSLMPMKQTWRRSSSIWLVLDPVNECVCVCVTSYGLAQRLGAQSCMLLRCQGGTTSTSSKTASKHSARSFLCPILSRKVPLPEDNRPRGRTSGKAGECIDRLEFYAVVPRTALPCLCLEAQLRRRGVQSLSSGCQSPGRDFSNLFGFV